MHELHHAATDIDPGAMIIARRRIVRSRAARSRIATVVVIAAFGGLAAAACEAEPSISLRGASLALFDCASRGDARVFEPAALDFPFVGTTVGEGTLLVRAASDSRRDPPSDTLALWIPDYRRVQDEIEALGVAVRAVEPEALRVGLAMLETCPAGMDALEATSGRAEIHALGAGRGDRVVAHFELDLVHPRSGASAGPGFTLDVDFEVQVGTPYQPFTDPFAQPHN